MTDTTFAAAGEDRIHVTATARRLYDALHAATAGGTRVFEGFLDTGGMDHGRASRAMADLRRLGVVASTLVIPGCNRQGRRLQLLVARERLVIGRRPRRPPPPPAVARLTRRPPPGLDEDKAGELVLEQANEARRRRRAMARFEQAWQRAFPAGARYHDDPRALAAEPRMSMHRPDARVL
jgi:hypothetical protein